MDDELAFCLDRFIDDQVQLIDDSIENIKKEEDAKCKEIEQQQAEHNRKKPPSKDKGSHEREKALVDRFCQDLRRSQEEPSKTKTIIDDSTCLDALRAELFVKVNSCTQYITRLRTLAAPLPNSTKFVELCEDTIKYFRRTQDFDSNFQELCTIIGESESDDVIRNIHKWWKQKYGAKISEIDERNKRFNPAITEPNFAVISATHRIIANAKKLLAARQVIEVEPAHYDIVRKFVRQLRTIDEDKRNETSAEELTDELNGKEIDQIIEYAERWLTARDEIRNQKEEDPYEKEMEEVKADFGRKRLAEEAKKLALAALLCRLAVGSGNDEQFKKQLKKTVSKQKSSNEESLPIVSGEIRDPEGEELPFMIQLELDKTDMEQWEANSGGIRERFAANLCEAFCIPTKQIRVDGVDLKRGIIHLRVLPPHGKQVVDSLNGGAKDAAARMKAVRQCCVDIDLHVESITLGEFGLKIENRLMDPQWNKKYCWPPGNVAGEHFWAAPLMYGGKPYHCPSGWKRYGVKVAANEKEFDAKWGGWHVAYHGTRSENASKILTSGLKVSTTGCFYTDGDPRVYVSPSIEYSAHPRYAFPWKKTNKNGETLWYQLVFQCRVNPASVAKICPETLIHNQYKQTVTVDPNFNNNELEWIIQGKGGQEFIKDDIICYGLMMRASSVDPATLSPSKWWKQSHHNDLHTK